MRRRLIAALVVVLLVIGGVVGWIWADRAHGERVLAIGDSLMGQAGAAIMQDAGAKGYDVQVSAIPGSGLLDTAHDWAQTASELIANSNPDIVVVEFIGDYGPGGIRPSIPPNSPAFFNAWRFAAQRLEDILTARHAQVYWVIGPPVAQPQGEQTLRTLDTIYATLQAPDTGSGHPPLINLNPAFGGPSGTFTEYLPGPHGSQLQVRQPDGTHLTLAGAEIFGRVVAGTIQPVSPLRRF